MAGFLPVPQRGLDGIAGKQSGGNIHDGHSDFHGLALGFSGKAHDTAHALNHEIIAGFVFVGSVLAKTGDGTVNEARIIFL